MQPDGYSLIDTETHNVVAFSPDLDDIISAAFGLGQKNPDTGTRWLTVLPPEQDYAARVRTLREAAQAMLAWTGEPYVNESCQVCGAYEDEGHADCEAAALREALLAVPASSEPGLHAALMRETMPEWFGQVPDWALFEWSRALAARLREDKR